MSIRQMIRSAARIQGIQLTPADTNYARMAIGNELDIVACNREVGDRNGQLLASAGAIYSLVKVGIGTRKVTTQLLIKACEASGYAADDPEGMIATLNSAWVGSKPRELSKIKIAG